VLSTPYHGVVSFDPPQIEATGLPDGRKVRAVQPITATVRVTNTGPGTLDVFADPRRADRSETDSLLPRFAPATLPLPGTNVPSFLVRPRRTRCSAPRREAGRSCSSWASARWARAIRTWWA